jgi:mono/diheme cytochrome c family protein
MKKVIAAAALVWTGAAVLLPMESGFSRTVLGQPASQSGEESARAPAGSPPPARSQAATLAQPQGKAAGATAAAEVARHRAWLKQYCVGCHNERNPLPANDPVKLDSANLDDVLADAATWERVLRKLSVRAMPPQGSPHPSEADYVAFTAWLSGSLDRGWAARSNPGRYVVHRLNRVEYRNAIRDLLALDVDVSALLPNDGGDFGFDNIAAALRTSPLLLDGYITAAQRISTLAVGDPGVHASTTEYSINRDFSQNTHVDGLPLGTRGGRSVRHVFPADGEYKLFGRLVRGIEEGYAGVESNDLPHTFVITVDGEEVYSAEIGGPKDHEAQAKDMNAARIVIDARMTARVKVTAGPHDIGFTFRDRPSQQQDVWQPALRDSQEIHYIGGLPKLKTVGIEGPYNATGVSATPSRERLFVCRPRSATEESACANRIVSGLARRAYRRPVNAVDLEAPLEFYQSARERGESFDAGIRAAVARVLTSPSFLYRIERDPAGMRPGATRQVSDVELASRLSFFLWSSIPDARLLTLAEGGRLREPGMLASEVKRMIADKRADSLVSNFVGQWLQLRNLESKVRPDILDFPDFDDNVREAFRRETELLFDYILRQDRSALELLSADYTFVNERLARHYGIPGIYGSRFRQVKLTDPNRRGLLGHGSILSLTSVATRTSPVYRGKFILSTFLNTPPPPPLPNVPTLEESAKGAASAPKTVRETLELHRSSPTCASCHRVIDPPGFALEKFNPVGQWRETMPDGSPIDTGGVLADGTKVDGPIALRNAILSRPEAFMTTLTERIMTYALGRGVEPSDMAVIRSIVKKTAQRDYALQSIITSVVESAPFQMRTKLDPGPDPSSRVASNGTRTTPDGVHADRTQQP